MKGRIVKRAESSWTLVYDLPRDASGRRRQKSVTVKGTKKQAQAELARIIHEIETGQYAEPTKETVESYLRYWVETAKRPKVKSSTLRTYDYILRLHVYPALGAVPLHRLQSHQLERLYAEKRAAGLSQNYVREMHSILHAAFKQAVRWKMIPSSPADLEEPPQPQKPRPRPLTREQLRQALAAAKGLPVEGPIVLMAAQGLRPSEALALFWEDIDFAANTLSVRRTLTRMMGGGQTYTDPKSETSRRTLALIAPARTVLEEAWQKRRPDSPLVFPGPTGKPRWLQDVRQAWVRLLKRENLPQVRLQDLRHTHSALLLQAKVPVRVVQERLGHSDPSITLRVYGSVMPGAQAEANAIMEGLLGEE